MQSLKKTNIILPLLKLLEERDEVNPVPKEESVSTFEGDLINKNVPVVRTKRNINIWLRERRITGHRNSFKKGRH